MKALIEQMEKVGIYDSKVMGPRQKKSQEDKESIKSDKTSEPNSANCQSEVQWAKERQSKQEKLTDKSGK